MHGHLEYVIDFHEKLQYKRTTIINAIPRIELQFLFHYKGHIERSPPGNSVLCLNGILKSDSLLEQNCDEGGFR